MTRRRLALTSICLSFVAAVAVPACDDTAASPCTPGQSIACTGDAACAGHQVCKADGSAYDDCVCATSSSSGASSASGALTGGAGGASSTSVGATSTTSASSSSVGGASSSSGGAPCTMVYQGSFTIQDLSDIAIIAPYCEITGDLVVSATNLTILQLPNLETLGGSLRNLGAMGLDTLDLPKLRTATDIDPRNGPPSLHVLNLPKLESAEMIWGGSPATVHLESLVSGRMALGVGSATIDLPSLTTGSVLVQTSGAFSAPQLSADLPPCTSAECIAGFAGVNVTAASISLPVLASARAVSVKATASNVSLPALTTIGTDPMLSILMAVSEAGTVDVPLIGAAPNVYVSALGAATLPQLTTVGRTADFEGGAISVPKLDHIGEELRIAGQVSSFSAPALETLGGGSAVGILSVRGSTLSTLSLPSLQSFGALLLAYPGGNYVNPNLSQIALPALVQFASNGPFLVGTNPMLPQCRIDALAAKMHAAGWAPNQSPQLYTTQPSGPCP
ncbi:MAG: hypothetical protein U0414_06410 [Polyangiaceae bacterium]